MPYLVRRVFCEGLGTAFLLAAVVGSGIMAQKLAGGNVALALLGNTLPTGAILVGADPDLRSALGRAFQSGRQHRLRAAPRAAVARRPPSTSPRSSSAPSIGVWTAHLMFELPLWQLSATMRTGPGQWLAEAVATFGLRADDLRLRGAHAGCRTLRGRPLHHLGLLVHGLDLVCQSGGNDRALAVRYLRRHRPSRRRGLHRRATCRDDRGRGPRPMALAGSGPWIA